MGIVDLCDESRVGLLDKIVIKMNSVRNFLDKPINKIKSFISADVSRCFHRSLVIVCTVASNTKLERWHKSVNCELRD